MSACGPSTLFMALTETCNLRCRMCHIWQGTDPEDKLTVEERVGLVRQYAAWVPHGTVAVGGGEPTLHFDDVLAIATECRRSGLRSVMNTNGTLPPALVEQLAGQGPDVVLVSLDSRVPETHDWLRGRQGTHGSAVALLASLAKVRGRGGVNQVGVSTVVSRYNIDDLAALARWVFDLGGDLLVVQPLAWTFASRRGSGGGERWQDRFFLDAAPRGRARVIASLQRLLELREEGFPIVVDAGVMDLMLRYFEDPKALPPGTCDSAERNLMVDVRGDVQLCFSMHDVLGEALGSVRATTLRDLATGARAAAARVALARCALPCGVLSCHARAFSTLTTALASAQA